MGEAWIRSAHLLTVYPGPATLPGPIRCVGDPSAGVHGPLHPAILPAAFGEGLDVAVHCLKLRFPRGAGLAPAVQDLHYGIRHGVQPHEVKIR